MNTETGLLPDADDRPHGAGRTLLWIVLAAVVFMVILGIVGVAVFLTTASSGPVRSTSVVVSSSATS